MAANAATYSGIRDEAYKKYRSRRLQEAFFFLRTISLDGDVLEDPEDDDIFLDDGFLDESSSPRRCSSIIEQDSSTYISNSKDPCKKQRLNSNSSHSMVIDDDCRHQKVHFDEDDNELEKVQATYLHLKEGIKDSIRVATVSCAKQTNKQLSGKRVVLVTPDHTPFQLFSIVPYKKKHFFGTTESSRASSYSNIPQHSIANSNIFIDNIDFGDGKQEVSYKHLLNPVIYTRKRRNTVSSEVDLLHDPVVESSLDEVEQVLLDDPELTSGKHRTVLNLPSFMVSIIQYAKPAKVKKDINERFKEEFPGVTITLTKLRSLKAEMIAIAQKVSLDCAIIACAFVYFERTILKTKITKQNRKVIAGACLLLSIKFCDDINSKNIKTCVEAITDQFRVSAKELVSCEIQVLILMEFSLMMPVHDVHPIYKRLEAGSS